MAYLTAEAQAQPLAIGPFIQSLAGKLGAVVDSDWFGQPHPYRLHGTLFRAPLALPAQSCQGTTRQIRPRFRGFRTQDGPPGKTGPDPEGSDPRPLNGSTAGQQQAQVTHYLLHAGRISHVEPQASGWVEDVAAGGMVENIAQAAPHLLPGAVHAEFLHHRVGRRPVAVETEESGVEPGYEILQPLPAISLRIEGDEQHLHLFRLGPECLHHLSKFGQRRRADVGAGSVAKDEHHRLAAEVRKLALPAIVIRKRQAAAELGAADAGAEKVWGLLATGGEQQKKEAGEQASEHGRKNYGTTRSPLISPGSPKYLEQSDPSWSDELRPVPRRR